MVISSKLKSNDLLFHSPIFIATLVNSLEIVKLHIIMGVNPMDENEDGITLLHFAARHGRLEILKYLIKDLGCIPPSTLLHVAAIAKQLHIIKFLIEECEMDPTAIDTCNHTPLNYACSNGELEMARYLFNCMRDSSMGMSSNNILYPSDEITHHTPRAIVNPLSCACASGHLSIVKYLIEDCKCDPSRPEAGKSPLLITVNRNHTHIVKYLAGLQIIKDSDHTTDLMHFAVVNQNLEVIKILTKAFNYDPGMIHNGLAPLHLAAGLGSLSIVRYLISLKCDFCIKDSKGMQPINYASNEGHLNVVRYLATKSKYHSNNACIKNCLHAAAFIGHVDIVRFFIKELKCSPNSKLSKDGVDCPLISSAILSEKLEMVKVLVDELGCDPMSYNLTALHVATADGNLSMLKYLIENKKCDPYVTDVDQLSILHHSVEKGQLHILQYLINDLKMSKDSHFPKVGYSVGVSLLSRAAMYGHMPVVKYLLEIGGDHLDQRSELTPLHYAAGNGHLELVKYLMTSYPEMYVLTPSISPSISPLQMATMAGYLNVVKYFLIDKKNIISSHFPFQDENTLVCSAAQCGQLDIVRYFVNVMKYDPTLMSKFLDTPLHHACLGLRMLANKDFIREPDSELRAEHLKVVKYLVEEMGCDVNSKNLFKQTPLHYAAWEGQIDIVRYLIEKGGEIVCYDWLKNTPLHYAAYMNHLKVTKFLTESDNIKDYPFKENNRFLTPLHVAMIARL